MPSDIGAEFRVAELHGIEDRRLWALGAAVVTRMSVATTPVVGDTWELGVIGMDAVWSRVDGTQGISLDAVMERFEAFDVEAIRSPIGGLWLVEAFRVGVLNLLDPGDLTTRVALASGSAVGAWELFAEYEMQRGDSVEWSDKYSSLPLLAELGAQRADLAMVGLDWDIEELTAVLRSRAMAVGAWQAEQVAGRSGVAS